MHSSPFGALPLILSNERSAAGVQQQKRALFFSLLNTVDGKAFFSPSARRKKLLIEKGNYLIMKIMFARTNQEMAGMLRYNSGLNS